MTVSDTLIGTVSVYDPDAGDSITLSVSSPAFSLQNTRCAPLKVSLSEEHALRSPQSSLSARIALPSRSVCRTRSTLCAPLKVSLFARTALPSRSVCLHALRSPQGQFVCTHCTPLKVSHACTQAHIPTTHSLFSLSQSTPPHFRFPSFSFFHFSYEQN